MSLPSECFPKLNTTDLTIEGIRAHARRQLGLEDTDKTQFSRKGTHLVTLTVGQWQVIERILDFVDKMKEINGSVVE